MVENPNPTKLDVLVRRNRGRTEHAYYESELANVLKMEIRPADILSLEETDRLFSVHKAQSVRSTNEADFAFKKVWKYEPIDAWLASCRCIEEKLVDVPAVLFAGPYEFCGGLRVSVDRALDTAVSILDFDQNTVRLQSPSSEAGLFLDLYEEDSEWLIDLVVWGQWKQAAQNCL